MLEHTPILERYGDFMVGLLGDMVAEGWKPDEARLACVQEVVSSVARARGQRRSTIARPSGCGDADGL